MSNKTTNKFTKEEKALLTFLKLTKNGKYLKLPYNFSNFSRISVQREESFVEEDYYFYSIR